VWGCFHMASTIELEYKQQSLNLGTFKGPKNRVQGINSASLCIVWRASIQQPYFFSVPSTHGLFKNSSTGFFAAVGIDSPHSRRLAKPLTDHTERRKTKRYGRKGSPGGMLWLKGIGSWEPVLAKQAYMYKNKWKSGKWFFSFLFFVIVIFQPLSSQDQHRNIVTNLV
jgi:hypothetical protein